MEMWRKIIQNWTLITCLPREWDIPHSGGRTPILCWWDVPPLGESCLYTPRRDVPPHESVNTYLFTGFSQLSYGNWDLLLRDFSRSKNGRCCRDYPSQRSGFIAPWLDVLPLGSKYKSAWKQIRIKLHYRDFSLLEAQSIAGIFPCWRWDL